MAISLIVTILENLNGFLKTDKEVIKMAKTFKASKLQILMKIILPANLSTFINSLKVNIGLSLVGVISGEFLVSRAGLRIPNCLWWASVQIRLSYGKCNYIRNSSWYYVFSSIAIRKIYPTDKKIQIRRKNFEEKNNYYCSSHSFSYAI